MSEGVTILTALITGGVVSALISWLSQRGKNKADASEAVSRAASSLVEPLTKRVDDLEREISELRSRIQELEEAGKKKDSKIRSLEAEIKKKDARIAELESRVKELECEIQLLRGSQAPGIICEAAPPKKVGFQEEAAPPKESGDD